MIKWILIASTEIYYNQDCFLCDFSVWNCLVCLSVCLCIYSYEFLKRNVIIMDCKHISMKIILKRGLLNEANFD